jgi:hypothetical protein
MIKTSTLSIIVILIILLLEVMKRLPKRWGYNDIKDMEWPKGFIFSICFIILYAILILIGLYMVIKGFIQAMG